MTNNTDNLNSSIERGAALREPLALPHYGESFDKVIYWWHRGWSLLVPSSLARPGILWKIWHIPWGVGEGRETSGKNSFLLVWGVYPSEGKSVGARTSALRFLRAPHEGFSLRFPLSFQGWVSPLPISFQTLQQGSFSAPLNIYSVPVFWEKTIHPLRAGMRNANVFWSLLTEASVQAEKKILILSGLPTAGTADMIKMKRRFQALPESKFKRDWKWLLDFTSH